jgi:hypothetical protein
MNRQQFHTYGRRVEGLFVDGRKASWVSVVVDARPPDDGPSWLLAEKEWVGPASPRIAAAEILRLRSKLVTGERNRVLYAGPEELLGRDPWAAGKWLPRQLRDAFFEAGLRFNGANEDPVAGLDHVRRLRTVDSRLIFPGWHPQAGEQGSRRLFVGKGCPRLREQLLSVVPAEDDEKFPGAAASPRWERTGGGLFVALCYACLQAITPSEIPAVELEETMRERAARERLRGRDEEKPVGPGLNYEWL